MSHDPTRQEMWMSFAIDLARSAACLGEVPVGAVIVKNERIVSTGLNLRESLHNPLAHAEILAIESASKALKSWRLLDCDLYVTLEPCIMCAGALYQARIRNVFFGASDPKGGALGSLYSIHSDLRLNHRYDCQQGLMSETCSKILRDFFTGKRSKKLRDLPKTQ